MNTTRFVSRITTNAEATSLRKLIVLIGLWILFSPAFCLSGPTSYGGIQITPSITSSVHQYSSIPVTVTVAQANGTADTSFSGVLPIAGAIGSETYRFQDNFETTITYSSIGSGGSTMSYDTTVYSAGSARSAKITGGNQNNLYGPFYDFGSNGYPVRYSCYMRSNSTTKVGPIVSMVELDGSYYTATNVMFDGSVGRIRMRRCTGSFGCTLTYSAGIPYVANQWYKIDVTINWSSDTVNLYIDDVLRDANFPLMYGSQTYSIRGISYYNYDNGVTGWVDNVRVISAEGSTTPVSISPTSINIVNGIWSGKVQVLTSGVNNMFLLSNYTSGSTHKEGRTNTFNTQGPCTPGQYSVDYYSTCLSCNAGSYSTINGAPSCTLCSPGTWQSQGGQTSCTNCSANTYNPNNGSTSIGACQACIFPETSDPGAASCSSCKPGEYYDMGVCKGCPNGTYGIGGPTCPQCPPGTYNNLTNQSTCASCPSGHVWNGQGAISISACVACPSGMYAANSTTCLNCDVGTWNNLTGQSDCFACPAGTYNNLTSSTNYSACIACPLGSHASLNGSSTCVPCDIGTYANVTGLANCHSCVPGSASSLTGAINCTICSPGSQAHNYGQDICLPCDPGTASNNPGEDMCPVCGKGWYSPSAGRTTCSKCLIGTYSNETGAAICYDCAVNYTTVTDGSDSESDCILQCGDGRLETGEFCDDGNSASGDGCTSYCTIENGYVCLTPGQLCQAQNSGSGGGGTAATPSASIAAAVVGAIVVVVCAVGVAVGLLFFKKRQQQQPPPIDMPVKPTSQNDNYRRIPSIGMIHSPIVRGTLESAEKIPRVEGRLSYNNEILYGDLDTSGSAVVGKGAFGVVFSAIWHGQKVAVKEIKNENISTDDVKKFIEEAELMRNLKPHVNVVLFLGVILEPFCIVTGTVDFVCSYLPKEFLDGGDLHTFLNSDSKIPMELQLSIIKDIAKGMLHLALEGIVHRDLAARNVLLTKDFTAKVSDFGLSRIADADNVIYSKSDIGPLKWMAPEAIRRKKYSEKSDVWAFGVTCWEIVSREEPFKDMDAVQVATAVVGEGLRPEIPHWTPPVLAEIITATWETDPDQRPTFHQLVNLLDTVQLVPSKY